MAACLPCSGCCALETGGAFQRERMFIFSHLFNQCGAAVWGGGVFMVILCSHSLEGVLIKQGSGD